MELVVREHSEKDKVANDREIPRRETRNVEVDGGSGRRLISAPDGVLIPGVLRVSPKGVGMRFLGLVGRLIILFLQVAAGVIEGWIGRLRHEGVTGRMHCAVNAA